MCSWGSLWGLWEGAWTLSVGPSAIVFEIILNTPREGRNVPCQTSPTSRILARSLLAAVDLSLVLCDVNS